MNRRTFGKSTLGGLATLVLSSVTIPLAGCSAITDLKNWIPVALSSVNAILKLLGPIVPAPVTAIVTLIQAGFASLLATIEAYQAGNGVLADITNAITAIEANFATFFQTISVPSTLLNLIEGLAGIILSTIAAFANQINPATVRVSAGHVTYVPKKRSRKQFVNDWNTMCTDDGHPEAKIA